MINKIIDGICKALNREFGDGYDIYTESIEQGLKEPCFFISCINPTNNLFLGKRYHRTNLFCIQYFPSTSEPKSECNSVLERMYDCLEMITVDGDVTGGTNMSGEVVDGVLNFFVNFDMFVYKIQNNDNEMNSYGVKTDAKG